MKPLTRRQILNKAIKTRKEIAQIFIDAEHWNSACRKPDELPIDPDPKGQLANIAKNLDVMIAKEKEIQGIK